MSKKRYLTQEEVADRYRGLIWVRTLANWRSLRIGPRFTKIGKTILYDESERFAWEEPTDRQRPAERMAPAAPRLYGGEWDRALVGPPAGNYHALTSDHTNDVVVRPADDSLQCSWLCDYLESVSPSAVISLIDEALAARSDHRPAKGQP